ncbi:ERCC4 domain-containing protein [Encephalitozoon cuniculi]|nr:ERCC4 domain-containing protein [Encephalitozoon cuniculi]
MKTPETQPDLMGLIRSAVNSLHRLSSSRNMKSRYCYKKMAQELDKIEGPLDSLSSLKSIKWGGDKVIGKIQEFIDKKVVENIKTESDLERYLNIISPAAYDDAKRRLVGRSVEDHGCRDGPCLGAKDYACRRRKYIPGYRTGGYAIMKALWIREGVTKHEIAQIGRNYCDAEFDFVSRHSAWSSMKTLVKKGLVYREGRSKFYLTDEGRELATTMFANTSVVEEEEEVTLIIDAREIKNRRSRLFFQEYFELRQVKHETRVLEAGDFLWVRGERVCSSIIERKRGSDFVSSIMDGRFKEQKNRLRNSGIRRIFYVVEGLKNIHMQKVGKELVMSCLTATKLEGFIVIETRDIVQTSSVIHMIDREVRGECEKKAKAMEGTEDHRERDGHLNISMNVGEETEMSYGSFIDRSSKGKGRTLTYLLYMSLLSIKGMGHRRAYALAEHYKTIGELIRRLEVDGRDKLYGFEVDGRKIPRRSANSVIEFFLE